MTDRDDYINRAADLLDSEETIYSYERRGLHLHHDSNTSSWWLVDDDDLEELGKMIAAGNDDAYSVWCSQTSGREIDLETIVNEWVDDGSDLDALQQEAGAADDMPAYMALRFLRDEIADIIAGNAEIAGEAA